VATSRATSKATSKSQRPPINLTEAKVRDLTPGDYFQGDTQVPGFGVRMRDTGSARYAVLQRLLGASAPTRVTLGTPAARGGEITLEAARAKARQEIAALRRGVDVNAHKRQRRQREEHTRRTTGFAPQTFGETALRYIAEDCALLARGKDIENVIRHSLLPEWGHRPLVSLRRADLTPLLDPIVASGKKQAAHKLREVAIRILNWAIDRGELEINYLASPSRGGSRRRVGQLRRNRRDRVLRPDEIRAIWAASEIIGRPFGTLVQLLLLLGQRRGDVAGMERRELELDQALWVIPVERYKKSDTDHAVPLPPAAVELLQRLPIVDDVYVLSTKPGTHISGYSKWFGQLRQLAGVDNWRLHDLRRTVRTEISGLKNAAGQRVGADIAERVLGHVIGGVRGVYDRYAYLDEKREALQLWAARIRDIVEPPPSNIVPLRPGAAA